MPAPTDLLQRVPLFQNLERRDLERIARSLRERTFSAGQTVTTEGQGGVGFFVIESGEATVSQGGVERGKIRSGDHFGEIALLRDVPRTATVTARTDASLYALERDDFVAAVTGHAESLDAANAVVGTRLAALRPRAASI